KARENEMWRPLGGLQRRYFIAGYEFSRRKSYAQYFLKEKVIERGSSDEGEQIIEADARFQPGEVWINPSMQKWMIQDRNDVALLYTERLKEHHNIDVPPEDNLRGMHGRVYLRFRTQNGSLGDRFTDLPVQELLEGNNHHDARKWKPGWKYDPTAGGMRRQCGNCGKIKTF